MTVHESDEVVRHRSRLELQARVRERIAALGSPRHSSRSATLEAIDRMLVERGFRHIVAQAAQRSRSDGNRAG